MTHLSNILECFFTTRGSRKCSHPLYVTIALSINRPLTPKQKEGQPKTRFDGDATPIIVGFKSIFGWGTVLLEADAFRVSQTDENPTDLLMNFRACGIFRPDAIFPLENSSGPTILQLRPNFSAFVQRSDGSAHVFHMKLLLKLGWTQAMTISNARRAFIYTLE